MDAFNIDMLGNIRVKNSAILDRERTRSIQCQVGSAKCQYGSPTYIHIHTYLMFFQKFIPTETLKGTWSHVFH